MIGVSEARRAALTAAHEPIPNLVNFRALLDTGASSTCVDPSILQPLNLTPTGSAPVETPSTGGVPVEAPQYDVSLILPAGSNKIPLVIGNLGVICLALASLGYHALIGRDILAQCIYLYNGSTRLFTLAY